MVGLKDHMSLSQEAPERRTGSYLCLNLIAFSSILPIPAIYDFVQLKNNES